MNMRTLSKRILANQYSPSDNLRDDHGWIDPSGKFWPVNLHGHEDFAHWWYVSNKETPPKNRPAVEGLEQRGWIHISYGTVVIKKNPNNRQTDTVYDWMKARGGKADLYGPHGNTSMSAETFLDQYAKSNRKIVTSDEKLLKKIRTEMLDRSGDEAWSKIALDELYKWVGSFDTVEEACDWLEQDSVLPRHIDPNLE